MQPWNDDEVHELPNHGEGIKWTLHFEEDQQYDIWTDQDVVTFMAISNVGTWHGVTSAEDPGHVRRKREEFKQYVMNSISLGLMPHEVYMD